MREYRCYNERMEYVADCLAKRDPDYAQGLSDEARALFDPEGSRKNYNVLQEVLTDLRLRERAELGQAFHQLSDGVASQPQGFAFQAAHFEGRDWVFLLMACKKCDKATLFRIMRGLTGGALANYQKRNCLVIVDRDGEHYDLALSKPGYQPMAEDVAIGKNISGDFV